MQKNQNPPISTPNVSVKTEKDGSYGAALLLTGSVIPFPIDVAFITSLLYIANLSGLPLIGTPNNIEIILAGFVIAAVLWLGISFFCRNFTTFDGANVQSSNHLKRHLLTLESVLQRIQDNEDKPDSSTNANVINSKPAQLKNENFEDSDLVLFRDTCPIDYELALESVCKNVNAAKELVKSQPLSWTMGTGYLKAWNFVHLAEEAMLNITPREFVIREALHDEAAIYGSSIALENTVLSNIQTAVKRLSPTAIIYLKSQQSQDDSLLSANIAINSNFATARINNTLVHGSKNKSSRTVTPSIIHARRSFPLFKSKNSSPGVPSDENENANATTAGHEEVVAAIQIQMEARNALRDARQTLNDFRTTQWDGLVRLRNQMFGTSLFVAFLTYTLLCAVIVGGINPASLKAASIFYLVGAIIGLFSRLYTEWQSDTAADDYGLTVARVMVIPIISGLAAIAGVLVVAYLSLNLLNTPGVTPTTTSLPLLGVVYDLVQNRQGIVIAAIFGLTPNLLINALQQKANDATTKLKNSTAPGQGSNKNS